MEIFILLALIFLNALFVMSEIALVSARKSKLETQADQGDESARRALNLANNSELFLSACQIGITLIGILTGMYSGENFAKDLAPVLENLGVAPAYAGSISTTIIVILVTFLTIVFGELIPKRIGLLNAEKIAKTAAAPMNFFAKLTYPMVWLLNSVSRLFYNLLNIKKGTEDAVTEAEIKSLIDEGTVAGTIDETEQEIIERVFHLGDRNITSLMTHRSDIIWMDLNDDDNLVKEKILLEPHSYYPVCGGSIDNIKGLVSIKDLYVHKKPINIAEIMKPALFVPDNNSAYRVLEKFKEQKVQICFVVDEYGTTLGLITLNDILEAIVGEMPQPDVLDYEIIKREDGTFLIDAQIPFYDFLTHFDKADWLHEGEHEFDTLGGFILHKLERIPNTSDIVEWQGFTIEIVDMDGIRIDKVLVKISDDIREGMEE